MGISDAAVSMWFPHNLNAVQRPKTQQVCVYVCSLIKHQEEIALHGTRDSLEEVTGWPEVK